MEKVVGLTIVIEEDLAKAVERSTVKEFSECDMWTTNIVVRKSNWCI